MPSKRQHSHPAKEDQNNHGLDAHDHEHAKQGHRATDDAIVRMTDPVCGMTVDPHETPHRTEHGGHTYYFCSSGCRQRFEADPSRYLAPEQAKKSEEPAPESTVYTCPMHPEVRQTAPGSCPICGMTLQRLMAIPDARPSPELVDMTRRFWIGKVLTLVGSEEHTSEHQSQMYISYAVFCLKKMQLV